MCACVHVCVHACVRVFVRFVFKHHLVLNCGISPVRKAPQLKYEFNEFNKIALLKNEMCNKVN